VDQKIIPKIVNTVSEDLVAEASGDDVMLLWMRNQAKTGEAGVALAAIMAAGAFHFSSGPPKRSLGRSCRRIRRELTGLGSEKAGNEAFAQEPTSSVAAVRIEAESHDRLAITVHVREYCDDADRHLCEIDVCVTDG
jgi:hypothetical protein